MEDELQQIHQSLLELVRKAAPKATSLTKYGGTLFTLKPDEKEGQFCGVFSNKNHVQISFSDGVHLDDPEGLLQGSGKGRRHINFKSVEQIKSSYLTKLIRKAAKLSIVRFQ